MKSFKQLGEAAYNAYSKKSAIEMAQEIDREWLRNTTWDQLDPGIQACWVAVAEQMVAEVAALH